MNAHFKVFCVLGVITLIVSGCAASPIQANQGERRIPKAAVHESILGESLADEVVLEFLAVNDCSSVNQFVLCKAAGMALWTDSNQVVETIYLYVNNTDGFEPYKGELPFGLKFYDTMGAVEYKLKRQGVGDSGLPDVGATPDHMHYQATYHQAGMTIIYNSPFTDEDATIYAVMVHN